ncbi:hypothetical protein POTOM_003062 [Populus tomentosa]|uniref:Uncharacterized protein n=1 Tax=Populus tomentosa TaxID=118781 RepID=A0A8X8DKU1_POPTO|nr:hypothetical protein POTOM_003062 [Populus tomentosa]
MLRFYLDNLEDDRPPRTRYFDVHDDDKVELLIRGRKCDAKVGAEMEDKMSTEMSAGMKEGMNSKMGIDIAVVLMLEFTWILMMIMT